MKARLMVSGFVALACVSVLAAGDTYSMTYQSTATSRAATTPIVSFAIARAVQGQTSGGPGGAAQKPKVTATNQGQIRLVVGKNPTATSNTFKGGSQFSKITIVLTGVTPAGAMAPMRHWVLTDAVIDSYAVTGSGPSAQAIINLHWKTLASTTP